MRKPYYMDGDEQKRTLHDFVEQFALGVAYGVINDERTDVIQNECKILDSLTNALNAIKF